MSASRSSAGSAAFSGATFGRFIGRSAPMLRVYRLIEKIATSDLPVLITGESGTGKELLARELHDRGKRKEGPFVAVNCGAITETLFESELFGHERGAFTGAVAQKRGRIETADGGTLFLDEVGELPVSTQVKLLRVLQDHQFERVGSNKKITADVRVIAATNRELPAAIKSGQFREDLFYRLNVIHVALPPLRERGDDVLLLAEMFSAELAKAGEPPKHIGADSRAALRAYSWPGNVRELRNAIERATVLADTDEIVLAHLPAELRAAAVAIAQPLLADPEDLNLGRRLLALELELVEKALERAGGDEALAAEYLGIDAAALADKRARVSDGEA
jgi:DNA-binding NtrC family response regulator